MNKDQRTDKGTMVFLNLTTKSRVVEARLIYEASVRQRFGVCLSVNVLHYYVTRLLDLCSPASKRNCTISVYGTKYGRRTVSKNALTSAYIAELMRENSYVIISITPESHSWSLSVEWKNVYPDTITIDLHPLSNTADGIGEVVETLSHHLFVEPNVFKRFWRFLTYKIQESPYLPPEKD